MNRKKRTEILIKGSGQIAAQLAREILQKYQVQTIEKPNHGLVMVKIKETAQQSPFYLGEVLVTECKVMINGCLGIGLVKGQKPDLAYHLAVIDGAYNADLPETKDWTGTLLLEAGRIKRVSQIFKNQVLKTKVNFETMDS